MNTKHGLILILIFTLSLFGLNACTTFHGITPIYPKVGHPNSPDIVDSLQPTLRWKPSSEPNVSYDLIIYEGVKGGSQAVPIVGREAYYRQGLKVPEHKVEDPLRPGYEYAWSVRVRSAEKVSDWSRYKYHLFIPCITPVGGGYIQQRFDNTFFMFKTP
jgi:hypothetical protein